MSSSVLTSAGFPPESCVFPVSSLRLRVLEGAHPWFSANGPAIARHWEREVAANPNLFDGRMVFQHELGFSDGHIEGRSHIVPYSAFLHWRAVGRNDGGHHLFGMPMIFSSDGALILIRMAETTANPGRVYAPAGSLDDHDIADGFCDLDGNMRREALEETGLDLAAMAPEAEHWAVHLLNSVAVFRIFHDSRNEARLLADIQAHIDADPEPEISAAIGIRNADPAAQNYSPFMLPILKWLFTERNR
jgi:8-oxo-dGTP pyrophosphatase MutT (NUDIX family)